MEEKIKKTKKSTFQYGLILITSSIIVFLISVALIIFVNDKLIVGLVMLGLMCLLIWAIMWLVTLIRLENERAMNFLEELLLEIDQRALEEETTNRTKSGKKN